MHSSLVAIRIFKSLDLEKSWKELPVVCYLPCLLSGPQAAANIEKRLRYLYFATDPSVLKIHWIFKDDTGEGLVIERA